MIRPNVTQTNDDPNLAVGSLSNGGLSDGNLPEKLDLAGRPALLRRMTADDRDAILRFARALPEEDLLFLRTDITEVIAAASAYAGRPLHNHREVFRALRQWKDEKYD